MWSTSGGYLLLGGCRVLMSFGLVWTFWHEGLCVVVGGGGGGGGGGLV